MAGRRIEYFLTTASPWAYLGHAELGRIAARHGATIVAKPMPVRQLFDETGGLPLPKRHPVRQAYRLVELQRWRAIRGLPLDPAVSHTRADPSFADRTAIAIEAEGGDPMPFLGKAMAANWADRADIADEGTIAGLLSGLGLDAAKLVAAARSDASSGVYERNLADAMATGVFGAPSYVLDGEVFWGQDRLTLLDDALASGRQPYRPS
jgi:2-hydroxychromene-2-carboxylate isomerase